MGLIERVIAVMAAKRNIIRPSSAPGAAGPCPGGCGDSSRKEPGCAATPQASEEGTSDAPTAGCLSLKVGMGSKRGPRHKNDDFCAISWKSDFFALSDGIGGAPYGDVISRVACNAAVEAFDESGDLGVAFGVANDEASRVSRYLGEQSGATLLLARYAGGELDVASVGDSMAYRMRGGRLEPVMAPGRVPGGGNALSKAVGYGPTAPDLSSVEVRPGDRVLLCSDGVWEYVDEEELVRLLSDGDNAPLIADSICRRAAEVGNDNSTCICLIFERREDGDGDLVDARADRFVAASTPTIQMACGREDVGSTSLEG